ncbi:flagellar motor switch phosphatase FliY [Pseudoneobacillus sp. C159]
MSQGSLSQDEINALFNQLTSKPELLVSDFLSEIEQDVLGEIGNISLGSSTTALSTLLNQRVQITTPTLSVIEREQLENMVAEKSVAVHVDYTVGIRGKNLLMIKEQDAKVIANLMMGGNGLEIEPEFTELHISAVQEAMNQMMGSAATSMSQMLKQKVDISPPEIDLIDIPPHKMDNLTDDIIIRVNFQLTVGDLIDSNMMQFIPLSFAKEMIHLILSPNSEEMAPTSTMQEPAVTVQTVPSQPVVSPAPEYQPIPQQEHQSQANANVQRVEFSNFTESPTQRPVGGNLDMLYDIPLEITVELGRTKLPIRKILELGPGAVIQLDKLAGEPVDILANQKLIAKGEVVVIEESFGVRITDIMSPADRLTKMTIDKK